MEERHVEAWEMRRGMGKKMGCMVQVTECVTHSSAVDYIRAKVV